MRGFFCLDDAACKAAGCAFLRWGEGAAIAGRHVCRNFARAALRLLCNCSYSTEFAAMCSVHTVSLVLVWHRLLRCPFFFLGPLMHPCVQGLSVLLLLLLLFAVVALCCVVVCCVEVCCVVVCCSVLCCSVLFAPPW